MKNLRLTTKQDFVFDCESEVLIKAIAKAEIVTSKLSSGTEFEKKHIIFAYKGNVFIAGYSSDTFIVIKIEGAEAEKDGSFGYEPRILTGVIKNRSKMRFSFSQGRLDFSAVTGRYTGSLETHEIGEDQVMHMHTMMQNRSSSLRPLPTHMLSAVREGINIVDLKDHYTKNKIVCGIRMLNGILDISAFDNFHMAYYRTPIEFDDGFTLALPVETFKMLDKFLEDYKDKYHSFHINGKEMRITSDSMIIVLPPVQADKAFFDTVPNYIKSLADPIAEVPFTQSAIKTSDNMFTLATEETRLSMTIRDTGRVDLSLITEHGSISDAFKFKDLITSVGKFTVSIDPRIFDDLFKKVSNQQVVKVRFFNRGHKGVSSCFMLSASNKDVKAFLIGSYNEEKEKQ